MNKILFDIFFILLFVNLVSSYDAEFLQICGGDNEFLVLCNVGDDEFNSPAPLLIGGAQDESGRPNDLRLKLPIPEEISIEELGVVEYLKQSGKYLYENNKILFFIILILIIILLWLLIFLISLLCFYLYNKLK